MYDLISPSMQAQFNLINKSNQSIKLSVNIIDNSTSQKGLSQYTYNKITIFKYSIKIENSQFNLNIYLENNLNNHFKKLLLVPLFMITQLNIQSPK